MVHEKNQFQALLGVAEIIQNFWKCMGGQKVKMQKLYQVGAYDMQNDERIPNLASEFKSDNIWPIFGQKMSKSAIIGYFANFRHFLAKKGVAYLRPLFDMTCILIFWTPMHFKKIEIIFATP